ncbi:hypothetical protein F5Y01DRAFT_276972 [Xylaria sp. FL0043]|nr:hypothetical protein F5Y01DRAFT_276972 [Xylaria sp. FL0043]
MPRHTDKATEANLQSGRDLLDHLGVKYTNRQLFQYYNVNERTGYRILKDASRRDNNATRKETRGRKRLLSTQHVDQMEQFLKNGGSAQVVSWQGLAEAAGIEFPSHRVPVKETIRASMNSRGWYKCMACAKFLFHLDTAAVEASSAREQLHQPSLNPEHGSHIRYSDEVHFKVRPEGKAMIKYCMDCNKK